jgi:hypothetical protein
MITKKSVREGAVGIRVSAHGSLIFENRIWKRTPNGTANVSAKPIVSIDSAKLPIPGIYHARIEDFETHKVDLSGVSESF